MLIVFPLTSVLILAESCDLLSGALVGRIFKFGLICDQDCRRTKQKQNKHSIHLLRLRALANPYHRPICLEGTLFSCD